MHEQKIINEVLKYVIDLLSKVNHYPYHNINHTLDVYSRVWHLADKEFVYLEEKTDLLLAALFHDTWFVESYFQNEIIGAKIARKYLEGVGFREDRIKRIENMILATIVFSPAKNKLEKIIQDADFDNLWRRDFLVKSLLVKKELNLITSQEISIKDWFETTYILMKKHSFKTLTAKSERDQIKKENLVKLKEKIKAI
ncbi:MAG: metal-dependent phosphohydrolase [uncultured bacterium (gcode 4)]|uniref:Metal-dependent phosphohydrolase n=1 Tax=uncultured bacterium (gcode 4) TaxID=1234023 RepID=K2AFP9_9BACT|nr:MAG: metal-dependent phosphohydrolase [uncultured bacterium (gcode 4)]